MEFWILWLIAAILLIIIEVLTQMVWTLCLAVGSIGAMLALIFGASTISQIIVLAVVSLVAFFTIVPWIKGWHENKSHSSRTGMDALLGRRATVVDEIRPGELGRVRIDGDNWQVRAPQVSETIPQGAKVEVTSYDSIILTVTPLSDNQ